MIGFLEEPTGQLGNVMIQYAFLRQLAQRAGVDFFHRNLPYAKYFENWGSHNVSLRLLLVPKKEVDLKYIESMGIDNFIEEIKNSRKHYVVKPPVLGHLFEFVEDNPGQYYEIKSDSCVNSYVEFAKSREREECSEADRVRIAIHYRGTDFAAWNSRALMNIDYYIRAIIYMEKTFEGRSIEYRLFTDDMESQTYRDIVSYLSEKNMACIEADSSRDMMLDMTDMAMCDAIISSPSTYAIIAGIIGKPRKKIVHCKDWVQYCVEREEDFWLHILKNDVLYYDVSALL